MATKLINDDSGPCFSSGELAETDFGMHALSLNWVLGFVRRELPGLNYQQQRKHQEPAAAQT